jgi:hypothetical protein
VVDISSDRRGIGGHQSARAGSNVWLTPLRLIQALGPFDLDPCSLQHRPWDTARHHIAPPDDGLTAPWWGRVWLNPPYSDVARWIARLADHGTGTGIVFARTETRWFHESIWSRASALLFPAGRITFCLPDGAEPQSNSGAPSVLVAYGQGDADLLQQQTALPGAFIRLTNGEQDGRPLRRR